MNKPKRIAYKNLPINLPINTTVLTWLALDHWNAPEWGYGAAIALGVIWWCLAIWGKGYAEYVDIFDQK